MARGRKTGGRQKGSRNRHLGPKAKSKAEVRAVIEATGETPLDYMLRIMRDKDADPVRRDDMAKAVAPYVHPRLTAIEHKDITPTRNVGEIYARLAEILAAAPPRRSGDSDRPIRH